MEQITVRRFKRTQILLLIAAAALLFFGGCGKQTERGADERIVETVCSYESVCVGADTVTDGGGQDSMPV